MKSARNTGVDAKFTVAAFSLSVLFSALGKPAQEGLDSDNFYNSLYYFVVFVGSCYGAISLPVFGGFKRHHAMVVAFGTLLFSLSSYMYFNLLSVAEIILSPYPIMTGILILMSSFLVWDAMDKSCRPPNSDSDIEYPRFVKWICFAVFVMSAGFCAAFIVKKISEDFVYDWNHYFFLSALAYAAIFPGRAIIYKYLVYSKNLG